MHYDNGTLKRSLARGIQFSHLPGSVALIGDYKTKKPALDSPGLA